MSDGEDDFMCEEEEDYGLVSTTFILGLDTLRSRILSAPSRG